MDKKTKAKELLRLTVIHWEENLTLAKLGKLGFEDISATRCALCNGYDICTECPLALHGELCSYAKSEHRKVYTQVRDGYDNKHLVAAVELMLNKLKFISEKYE